MEGHLLSETDIDDIYKNILPTIAAAVRASAALPANEQHSFYSTFSQFNDVMDVEGDRATQLMRRILKQSGIKIGAIGSSSHRDIDDQIESLIDVNDQLTERISNRIDEASGLRKSTVPSLVTAQTPTSSNDNKTPKSSTDSKVITASWNKKTAAASTPTSYRLLAARFVQRPQTTFKDPVDNSDTPFSPRLDVKHNAKLSLRESLMLSADMAGEEGQAVLPNPYKYEIEHLEYPEASLTTVSDPQLPSDDPPPFKYIDTEQQLNELIEDLEEVNEIAIDLEHHNYRSFQGFTCLMQISTRSEDYIIDTLKLRSELNKLNTVFTDPSKIKVFHGAQSDVEWLQKDFSLYIVNMFDTYHASHVLELPKHSLSYLLSNYCSINADKQYQLADWRIRPLPEELLSYARQDTRYLLYIYDVMKNELLSRANNQTNLLMNVYNRSADNCKLVYIKPHLTDTSYKNFYNKSRKNFNDRQLEALRLLFNWRYRLAQEEDESTGYILPNHLILQISEMLPREVTGILACCNPIPPLVRQHVHTIHDLVNQARRVTISTSAPIRQQARVQGKLAASILTRQHDTPSSEQQDEQSTEQLMEEPAVRVEEISSSCNVDVSGVLKSVPDLPITDNKHTRTLSTQDLELILKPYTKLLQFYSPTPFIDFTKLNEPIKTEDTKIDQSEIEFKQPQRMKRDNEEKSTNEDAALEPGQLPDSAEVKELCEIEAQPVKKKKKEKPPPEEPKPLRDRPAQTPSCSFKKPSEDFQPYEYSREDYSEFKQPRSRDNRRGRGGHKPKKFAQNRFRPDASKMYTYKQ